MESPNIFDNNPFIKLPKSSLVASLIMSEVLAYGFSVTSFTDRLFIAQDNSGSSIGFRRSWSTTSSVVGNEMCNNKAVTKALMKLNGVPIAEGRKVPRADVKNAEEFVREHGWPVVVKPIRGAGGRGVTANIQSYEQLREAIPHADSPRGFLIERHIPGRDYRFLVVGSKVVGVWSRDAASVAGDGVRSISELIDAKNEIRAANPHLHVRPIKKNELVQEHLKYSSRSLEDVPAKG